MIKFLIIAHLIMSGGAAIAYPVISKAEDDKIKRLGYVSTESEKHGFEKLISCIQGVLGFGFLTLCPIINWFWLYFIFKFDSFTDEIIHDGINEGTLIKAKEPVKEIEQKDYLAKRIEDVKKYQNRLGMKNKPRAFSDFSTDEKIAMLLHELELVYEEKAQEMGIDLSEEVNFCQDEESKNIKKGKKVLGLTRKNK